MQKNINYYMLIQLLLKGQRKGPMKRLATLFQGKCQRVQQGQNTVILQALFSLCANWQNELTAIFDVTVDLKTCPHPIFQKASFCFLPEYKANYRYGKSCLNKRGGWMDL